MSTSENTMIHFYGPDTQAVGRVVWSPDGKRIACGNNDGKIVIHTVTTGEELITFDEHRGFVLALSWSSQSEALAAIYQDGMVIIWHTLSGALLFHFDTHAEQVICTCQWSPAQTLLAFTRYTDADELSLEIRNTQTGECFSRCIFNEPYDAMQVKMANLGQFMYQPPITALAWAPQGDILVLAQGYKLHFWNLKRQKIMFSESLRGRANRNLAPESEIHKLAYSPNGTCVAFADKNIIEVWNIEARRTIAIYRGHKQHIQGLFWLPDGKRLVSFGDDLHVWKADTAMVLAVAQYPGEGWKQAIFCSVLSPDQSNVASGCTLYRDMDTLEGFVRVWQHGLSF